MKVLLFVLGLFLSLNVHAQKNREPHVVFLIHGFYGDDSSFGNLPQILARAYANSKNVYFKEIFYPSRPYQGEAEYINGMVPYEFALIANTQMINFFIEKNLPSDTPISFVAHSQGGTIAMRYINTCTKLPINPEDKKYCEYYEGIDQLEKAGWFDPYQRPKWLEKVEPNLKARLTYAFQRKANFQSPRNVKNLISIGTPFWGSAFANQYLNQKSLMNWVLNKLGFPNKQLNELSIGSQEPTRLRWMLLNFGLGVVDINEPTLPTDVFKSLEAPQDVSGGIRYFNLTGLSKSRFLKSKVLENDLVVGVPEASMDFLYYSEPKGPEETLRSGFANASKAFYPTDMVHVDLPLSSATPMAYVTWDNYQNHLGYVLIKRIFDNEFGFSNSYELTQAEKNKYFVSSLSNFTSEVRLTTPPGYHRQFTIQVKDPVPQIRSNFKNVVLRSSIFVDPAGQNGNGALIKNYYAQTYYHIGKVAPQYAFKPRTETLEQAMDKRPPLKINYEFDVVGFVTKKVSLDVFPAVNSYAELLLQPFHPIEPADHTVSGKTRQYTILHVMKKSGSAFDTLMINDQYEVKRSDAALDSSQASKYSKCVVGLMGRRSPEDLTLNINRRKNFVAWEKYALNKSYVFRNFDDENLIGFNDSELVALAKSKDRPISSGHVFEILGRFKSNVGDRVFDRYLVTSPLIRELDKVRYADIGKTRGRGLRWVNVVDLDIPEVPEVAKTEWIFIDRNTRTHLQPYTRSLYKGCLKNNVEYFYPTPAYFQHEYYGEDSTVNAFPPRKLD